MRGIDERHHDAANGLALRRQKGTRRVGADVGKIEALGQIGRTDQHLVRHALRELDDTGRRRKTDDTAAAESRRPLSRSADLNDRHVLHRRQTQTAYQDVGGGIGGAPDSADADALAAEVFRGADRFLDDQFVRKRIDIAGDHDQTDAPDDRARDRVAGGVADFYIAGDDAGHADRRALDEHKVGVNAVFLIEAAVLGDEIDGVRRIGGAVGYPYLFLGDGVYRAGTNGEADERGRGHNAVRHLARSFEG